MKSTKKGIVLFAITLMVAFFVAGCLFGVFPFVPKSFTIHFSESTDEIQERRARYSQMSQRHYVNEQEKKAAPQAPPSVLMH